MRLRDYQRAAVSAIMDAASRGVYRQLGVMATGLGKGQPVDTPILTQDGWKTMGELVVGDLVPAPDGTWTRVVEIFDRPYQPTFYVKWNDGSYDECDGDHLWPLMARGRWWRRSLFRAEDLAKKTYKLNYWEAIPNAGFPTAAVLREDPFELGLRIGVHEDEIPPDVLCIDPILRERVLEGMFVARERRGQYRSTKRHHLEEVCRLYRSLGKFAAVSGETIVVKDTTKRLKAVVPSGRSIETRCIRVDREDSLYLTSEATTTHNTYGLSAQLPNELEPFVRRQRGGHGGMLFVVHRREILLDAVDTFRALYPDRSIGVEMGELHATGEEDFVFASVDSLGRLTSNRIFRYGKRMFGVIVNDEAHAMFEGGTRDNVATFFGVGSDPSTRFRLPSGDPILSLLLTATPNRTDGRPLAPFADEVVFEYGAVWAIRNGWLTDVRAHQAEVLRPDGTEASAAEAAVRAVVEFGRNRRVLVFVPRVEDSKVVAETLTDVYGFRAAHVDGTTDPEERARSVAAFKAGDLDVLTNVGVFAVGTNIPAVDMIVDAAPTKSELLFVQKVGRGLRPHPEARVDAYETAHERIRAIANSPKPIFDYIAAYDLSGHDINVVAMLTGKPVSMSMGERTLRETVDVIERVEEEQKGRPLLDAATIDELEVRLHARDVWTETVFATDLRALTPAAWVRRSGSYFLCVDKPPFGDHGVRSDMPCVLWVEPDGEEASIVRMILRGGWCRALRSPVRAQVKELGRRDMSAQAAVVRLDRWMLRNTPHLVPWRGSYDKKASEKLRERLRKAKIPHTDDVSEAAAMLLLADRVVRQAVKSVDVRTKKG